LVGGRAYINSGPFTIGEGFTISNACEWRYYDNNGGFTHTGPITLAGGAWLQMRHRGDKFPIVFAGAIDDRDGPGVVDNYYWQSDTANDTQWLTKFNGNNTYSGPTTNYQGTLLINGTTSGQGDYVMRKITGTVWGGANLGGTDTVGLASGKTIILSSVTNAGGTAGANDRLIVTGGHVDLTSDGTQRLTITNSAGSTLSGAYVLATFDAASGYGRFDTVTYNGGPLPPGYMVHYEPTQIEFGPPHMPGVLMMVR
jgi:autotransporter-associated beta strand protein